MFYGKKNLNMKKMSSAICPPLLHPHCALCICIIHLPNLLILPTAEIPAQPLKKKKKKAFSWDQQLPKS